MNLIQSNVKTMSSREIAELTGKEHSNVKRDISAMILQLNYPDKLLKDCPVFDPSDLRGHGIQLSSFNHAGNLYDEFLLNEEYSLLLVSGYKVSLRLNIIKRWHELEAKQEAETPEQLMARALISAQSIIASKDAQIEAAQPAIRLESAISNDVGTMSMTEAGKGLQVKPRMFINWLYEHKYIDSSNMPYQRWINQGLLVISTIEKNGKPRSSTRVTGKGFAYFGGKVSEVKFANKQHYLFYK
ncbi:MAG: hypothetical protein GY799_33160 [Desulfobulbaceae bacterium]|nr:hypothetical protein [Desulfobulbaceae bacterium]